MLVSEARKLGDVLTSRTLAVAVVICAAIGELVLIAAIALGVGTLVQHYKQCSVSQAELKELVDRGR